MIDLGGDAKSLLQVYTIDLSRRQLPLLNRFRPQHWFVRKPVPATPGQTSKLGDGSRIAPNEH
jgi:hypothetical protein